MGVRHHAEHLFISLHGIAMLKGLYFTAVVFFSFFFFWCLISEVTERISTKLVHIFTYDCCLKNLVRTSLAIFCPPPHWLGGKKTLFGTNFELWPNVSLQRNMILNIVKKLVNLHGLSYISPKFGELWSRNTWEGLASYCPPPKFLPCETLPSLPHGRYIKDSRQTSAHVM